MLQKEINHMHSDGVTDADRQLLALQIKRGVNGKILVVGIDYGGLKNYRGYEGAIGLSDHLSSLEVDHNYGGTVLPHYNVKDSEYRPVIRDYSRIEFDDSTILLLYDDWSTSGVSWIGPLQMALMEIHKKRSSGKLGNIERVYVATDRDSTGGPHFSAVRTVPYIGTREFVQAKAPSVYSTLERLEMLGMIGDVDSEIANLGLIKKDVPLPPWRISSFYPRRISDSSRSRHLDTTLVGIW